MKRKADMGRDEELRPDTDLTADVPFEIEGGVAEEPAAVLPEDDDIPMAVIEEAAPKERRSAWRYVKSSVETISSAVFCVVISCLSFCSWH